MATIRTLSQLYAFFETGDKPTQAQFEDLIYTMFSGLSEMPKMYKVLISQNAAVPTKTSGTVPLGSIWTITTFVSGDNFSNWQLLSGSANTTGAVYRATTTAPTTWTHSSDLAYDARPYIVSTDANDFFNPLINNLGAVPVITLNPGIGAKFASAGLFTLGKTDIIVGSSIATTNVDAALMNVQAMTDSEFTITSFDYSNAGYTDDVFYYTSVTIIVYP